MFARLGIRKSTMDGVALDRAVAAVRANGGNQVVEPYDVPGVGRACYVVDPAGVLIGLHENDPDI